MATLGLGLAEGKAVLAALQRHLVAAQVDEHCRSRRRCGRCGAQRPLRDLRPRRLASLFGVVAVRAPRFGPCRCGVACRRSITPVAEVMPDRCTPEYERVVAAMGAALPYRRVLMLRGSSSGSVRVCANRLSQYNIIACPRPGTQKCGRSDRTTWLGNCATKPRWREI